MALRLADRVGYLVSEVRLGLPVPVRVEGPFAGAGAKSLSLDMMHIRALPTVTAAARPRPLFTSMRSCAPHVARSSEPESRMSAARWFRSYGGGVRLRDRHFCATCRHIVAERRGTRDVLFRCGRLGWETKPGWRFSCWQERPAGERMRRVDAAAADDDGNCAGMEGD